MVLFNNIKIYTFIIKDKRKQYIKILLETGSLLVTTASVIDTISCGPDSSNNLSQLSEKKKNDNDKINNSSLSQDVKDDFKIQLKYAKEETTSNIIEIINLKMDGNTNPVNGNAVSGKIV